VVFQAPAAIQHDYASRHLTCGAAPPEARRRCRLRFIGAAGILWVVLLLGRLYQLQVLDGERWRTTAARQHTSSFQIASERGPILDRNRDLLAVSVPAGSVFARPRKIPAERKRELSAYIAELLKMPRDVVLEKLNAPEPFLWVKRQVPRVQADKLRALNVEGLDYMIEPRRYYPYNEAGSSLLGKVGIDGAGLSGIEAAFDRRLRGEQVKTILARDALGNPIQNLDGSPGEFRLPKGAALQLTVDAALQLIVNEELHAALADTKAKGTAAVMIDGLTGEILAMGQAPSFDYNSDLVGGQHELVNSLIETVYEPGSTLKPVTAALALEQGVIKANELVNCENGAYHFGRHTINDVHGNKLLNLRDIIVRSSNIGISKVGWRLGRQRLFAGLQRFGFGEPPRLALPGETPGILRPVSAWAEIDVLTHSFGQGLAVTPLQMVRAFAAIANGGLLPELRLTAGQPALKRVMSPATSEQGREMLFGVVEDPHGTGQRAAVENLRIGGKTGTAQKAAVGGRGYLPGTYVASFVGFADVAPLKLNILPVLIVLVDEPHAATIYGGTLAAPVFHRMVERSVHLLVTRRELQHGSEPGRAAGEKPQDEELIQVAFKR
jgi:cell division protein FtsI (penicillin-binding protein 3)